MRFLTDKEPAHNVRLFSGLLGDHGCPLHPFDRLPTISFHLQKEPAGRLDGCGGPHDPSSGILERRLRRVTA